MCLNLVRVIQIIMNHGNAYALSWFIYFFNGRGGNISLILEGRKISLVKWRRYLDFLFRFLFFPILGFTAGDAEEEVQFEKTSAFAY